MFNQKSVLQRVLSGRIVFTLQGNGYEFEAQTRFDRLFSGVVAPMPTFLKGLAGDPLGIETIGPEDTGFWRAVTG